MQLCICQDTCALQLKIACEMPLYAVSKAACNHITIASRDD
ncbi:hypothetical protein SAMN05443248_0152 [Bradyrhizobium erythrophlei]|jgi:hypothetical protein|uniref:Uncharacterized protein n=1 Tax=Bradyrhizobium erythrophlei TaxID=1437360 RepID=A0A1M5GRQ2_9BRAD|nr:hypothetical protein SAMN05443248_0152 [Bradyrhizobium erythrophlei]